MSSSTNRPIDKTVQPNVDATIDFGTKAVDPHRTIQSGSASDSAPPVVDADSPDGRQFGHYTLLEEIARGGMGVVYRARDNKLNRTVALKMILSGRFASESDVRRFYQEAEAAASLDHPGIVPIYEIGEQEGHHFFSMKLIEGGSLAEHLPTIRDDQQACASLVAEIAGAVHHAHQRGILHRDIKPANILMDTDSSPLVSDLGLAKDTATDSDLTHTGAVVGSPCYMSPEQASGSRQITTATDIYAIGAILYEGLTGRPPHKGETVVETLRKVVDDEPSTPRSINSKINGVLQLICMKCLSKDPNQRYASAAALADDLERWLNGDSVSVRPPSWSSAVGEIFMSNLRSAAGAAVLGILAGWLGGHCLAHLSISGNVLDNPPSEIFAAMDNAPPFGMSLVPVNTVDIRQHHDNVPLLTLALAMTLATVGMLVALVTRPRNGNAAFAVGTVSALLMTFVMFGQTSFMSIQTSLDGASFKDVQALASLATADDGGVEEAKALISDRFPQLQNMESDQQANTLAYYIHYKSVFAIPLAILTGMVISAIFCLAPCTLGTTFASKLLQQKTVWWKWLLRSFEFGWLITLFCAMIFLVTLLGLIPDAYGPFEWSAAQQLYVYAIMLTLLVGMYHQNLRWWWRLPFYFALFAVAFIP